MKVAKTFRPLSISMTVVTIVLTTFGFSNSSQGKLSQKSQELIAQVTTHRNQATVAQKNSYYFNLGNAYIADPITTGQAIFEESTTQFALSKLVLPTDSHLICKLYEANCLQTILTQSKLATARPKTFANDNNVILNRYYQFLQNPPAVTLAKDIIESPLPDYAYLMMGQRLSFMYNLQLANTAKPQLALQNSLDELEKIRLQYAQADTLLSKMTFQIMMINQLQQIILLKTQFNVTINTKIPSLTPAEKDMALVFANEFYAEIFTLQKAISSLPQKITLYQHDKTVNAIADYITQQIKISKLPAPMFAQYRQLQLKNPSKDYPIKTNKIKNHTGYILANIAIPDYQAYTERVLGMENLITITNYILLDKRVALKNSFFPNTKKFTQTDNKLCMPFPTIPNNNETYQRYECMWV